MPTALELQLVRCNIESTVNGKVPWTVLILAVLVAAGNSSSTRRLSSKKVKSSTNCNNNKNRHAFIKNYVHCTVKCYTALKN